MERVKVAGWIYGRSTKHDEMRDRKEDFYQTVFVSYALVKMHS